MNICGMSVLSNINITNKKGFGHLNLVAYWKRKYKNKVEKVFIDKS